VTLIHSHNTNELEFWVVFLDDTFILFQSCLYTDSHIKFKFVLERWPLLCSRGQSSWLQIQRSRFDPRRYQIFWEVVGLERGPLSLVTAIEELLERESSGCGLAIREYGRRDSSRWPHDTLYPQKLALTSRTSDGRSVRGLRHGVFFSSLREIWETRGITCHSFPVRVVRRLLQDLTAFPLCATVQLGPNAGMETRATR
jgi:hypothetical protein